MQQLYNECSLLFKSVLSVSEHYFKIDENDILLKFINSYSSFIIELHILSRETVDKYYFLI